MGVPFDVVYKEGHVEFRLPNKPDLLCLIDKIDFRDHVQNTKCWYIHRSTAKGCYTYYIRTSGGKRHLHRTVLNTGRYCPKESVVDHKNRNGLDNRRDNLREGTTLQNVLNSERCANVNSIEYKGLRIYERTDRAGNYQCYNGLDFVGGGNSVDKVKEKIDKYISKTNSGEEENEHGNKEMQRGLSKSFTD